MRKFIITSSGKLKYGDVRLHKHLLGPGEDCWGGGFYEFNHLEGKLILSGQSFDYGTPKWHWLETLRLPESFRGLRITYDDIPLDTLIDVVFED